MGRSDRVKERRPRQAPPLQKVYYFSVRSGRGSGASWGKSWAFVWGLAIGVVLTLSAVLVWLRWFQEYRPIAGGG